LGNSTTKAIRASKTWGTLQLKQSEHLKEWKKKASNKQKGFFMVKAECSTDSSSLLIFHQYFCGLWKKDRQFDKFLVSKVSAYLMFLGTPS
jgi:hypothetical protein